MDSIVYKKIFFKIYFSSCIYVCCIEFVVGCFFGWDYYGDFCYFFFKDIWFWNSLLVGFSLFFI